MYHCIANMLLSSWNSLGGKGNVFMCATVEQTGVCHSEKQWTGGKGGDVALH